MDRNAIVEGESGKNRAFDHGWVFPAFVASHPCDRKKSQGWGTELLRLLVEEDDEAELRRGYLGGHVNAHLTCLHNVLPAGAGALDREVVAFGARGDLH